MFRNNIIVIIVFQLTWTVCPQSLIFGQTLSESFPDISGQSKIIHYTKTDYTKESQFWAMAEDDTGLIYFGTNNGVIIFDGKNWSHLSLPNNSSVHTVARGNDGKIYIGGYNEFGTVERDGYGAFYYQSMIDLLPPDERNTDEVWQILPFRDLIIVRSFDKLIIVSNGKAIVLPTQNRYRHISLVKEEIYVVDETGIHLLDPFNLKYGLLIESNQFNNEEIISILPAKIGLNLIAFSRQGNSYIIDPKSTTITFDKNHLDSENSDQIFSAIKTKDGLYYLGTINSHLIIYNRKNGSHSFHRNDLQDKTVLNIYESRNGNIWTLLNKGVDCLEISFPGSALFEGASVYSAVFHKNKMYLATNQGVYESEVDESNRIISRNDFTIIEGLEAQAWDLNLLDDKVFVGHDKGTFVLEEEKIYKIKGTNGIWKTIPIKDKPNVLLTCGYEGLQVIERDANGVYVLQNKVENFDISTRDIIQGDEPGIFWVCHGYLGVFKISLNEDFTRVISKEHFTDKNGLPSQYSINVTKYEDQILFLSKNGLFTFDKNSNSFIAHPELNEIFNTNLNISKLTQFKNESWFIQDNSLGYFTHENPKSLQKSIFSSLNGTFITSMEFIAPIENKKVVVANNEGLYLYDLDLSTNDHQAPTLLSRISYKDSNDSLNFVDLETNKESIVLPNDISSLSIHFTAPLLSPRDGIQFSYKLNNFDKSWSTWDEKPSREYSYLKQGNYEFHVKGKSLLEEYSKEAIFKIEILPIWYKTKLAYLVFVIFLGVLAWVLIFLVRRKLDTTRKEEAKLRKVLELELQQMNFEREKELMIKDNEKLEYDIVNKSKEIANYTLLLVNKHELLSEINRELNDIKKYAKLDKTKNSIRNIAKKISLNLQDEEHLKVFDTNFERVHHEFFDELKAKFPDLQQKELRLCGLVKMNMTNKEIASILNISVRGIETARYRLRKRLSIDQDVNIVEFLETLSSSSLNDQFDDADENENEF
ncbi:MAG: hypothetical protein JXR07_01460 [Reichenbachiella sp.]